MSSTHSQRFRRTLVALALTTIGLGAGNWTSTTPSTSARPGDSVTAPSSSRAPIDGVAPAAGGRGTDVAPTGRSRSRWIGEVLALLALVALWTEPVRWSAVRRPVAVGLAASRARPALGRAPPVLS